jgi:LL-diaminopimelate aminotransferase
MIFSKRVTEVPPYLFAEMDKVEKEMQKKGVDVISLGVGDPDVPTPEPIIHALNKASKDPINHRYSPYEGMLEFRQAAANWYKRRFDVNLDPEKEVHALMGVKEGVIHFLLSMIDSGDMILVMDPSYPIYEVGAQFAGGEVYRVPLLEKNHFLPDLSSIPKDVVEKSKLIFINYPHNPTASVASLGFFQELIKFAQENEIIVCNDLVYSELYFDHERPPSLLQVEGAKESVVEFHSLSKTFNMTGWRIGFAVGNPKLIGGLGVIKTNTDSGLFRPIQIAGKAALDQDFEDQSYLREIYRRRQDIVMSKLKEIGLEVDPPKATFYVWIPIPWGSASPDGGKAKKKGSAGGSIEFCRKILERCGVVLGPGIGWGEYGEGYFRIALTIQEERLQVGMERLGRGILEGP